jgi:tryptophan synthase alpha chain
MSPRAPEGAGRIERAIRAASPGRLALASFLTAGFPDRERFAELLEAIARECDLVELGVPFSDPMADGVSIQRSSRAALEAGVTLTWILEIAKKYRGEAPLLLMSYLNPLLAMGAGRLATDLADARVAGLIVPDLPFEETALLQEPLGTVGVALVQLVTPVTPPPRLKRLCEASQGFVYAVTITGTTGSRAGIGKATLEYLRRIRSVSRLPVLAGFGVRSAPDVRALAGHADGVIVGSALIETIENGGDPAALLRTLRESGRSPVAAGGESAESPPEGIRG